MHDVSPCFRAIRKLNMLPRTLFEQLLAAHSGALTGAGLDPRALTDADRLWDERKRLPLDLVDAIHRAHDMSDDVGYDHLLFAAGGPLFVAESGGMSAFTLAVQTLVERPELFNRAQGRRCVEALRRFREFPGKAVLPTSVSAAAMARAQARFSASFKSRDLTEFCRIRPWRETATRHFIVSHARCFRVDEAVLQSVTGCTETEVPWRPQQHDLVVFDERTGRLRVSARDAIALGQYLEGFGEALFGDPTWFREGEVVSLEPLVLGRELALRPTRGLLSVKLVEIEVVARLGGTTAILVRGDDVPHVLDELFEDPTAYGPLRSAKFVVKFRSDGRSRTIAISVPDRVSGDWRRDGGAARGFLEERGFLAGPPQEASCQVA